MSLSFYGHRYDILRLIGRRLIGAARAPAVAGGFSESPVLEHGMHGLVHTARGVGAQETKTKSRKESEEE